MEEGQQDEFKATSEVSSAATVAELGSIKESGRALAAGAAHPIATNIKLLSACLEALPDILSGASPIPMLRALTAQITLLPLECKQRCKRADAFGARAVCLP